MSTLVKAPAGKRWNRTAEEAERLSISQDLLGDLFVQGIAPGIKIGSKIVLFDPDAVDAALEKRFGNARKFEVAAGGTQK